MALTTCRDCRREVSTEAPTCPHCGLQRPQREPDGSLFSTKGWITGIGVLVVAAIGLSTFNQPDRAPPPAEVSGPFAGEADQLAYGVSDPSYSTRARIESAERLAARYPDDPRAPALLKVADELRSSLEPPPPSELEVAKAAAVERFRGMPGVRYTLWAKDGDFVIAAVDNGKSWQPVADMTCAWIRGQGHPGRFAVVVLEHAALQNKRWEQMARARCA